MSSFPEIRSAVISNLIGKAMRTIDLVLEHHTDQGKNFKDEVRDIEQEASYILFTYYFGKDAVCLMDSSKFKLSKKLEESDALAIRNFIDQKKDPHAADGDDGCSRPLT